MERSAVAAQASRRMIAVKQNFGHMEPSAPRAHSSLRASSPAGNTPLPSPREASIRPPPEPLRHTPEPQASSDSALPVDRSRAGLRNVVTVTNSDEKENSLQNGKTPHSPDTEADTTALPEEPLDSRPASKPSSNPFAKPSTSSNPFAKASNSPNPSTTDKQNGPSSGGEVSLLDSLKKMQKKGSETGGQKKGTGEADGGKKKRKTKASTDKPKKPPKVPKEAKEAAS